LKSTIFQWIEFHREFFSVHAVWIHILEYLTEPLLNFG
jgi:hypothetical protein